MPVPQPLISAGAMTVTHYIEKLNTRYKSGITTEHSFRGDLQALLETLLPDILVTNEPTRISCGAPDYILTKKAIPVGYIEAKDLGADLNSKGYKEQFTRYKGALPNLIITNYLDFLVYKDGDLVATYSIGTLTDGKVIGKQEQYEAFTALIKNFADYIGQTIKSAQKLAEMMAHKAKILASVIDAALESDEQTTANSTLEEQYKAFQDILIHDITPKGFADIYAQTIAYGMFAARLHDPSLESFTRQEASELIPRSNPFLRKLFQYIAGYDLDRRIVWIVDALADIFRATDVKAILKNFGRATKQHDPIIHFYETFLSEYDPSLRKSRGVWYTPEPVVNFIVRAVDDILKTEFGLSEGLADTSKVKIKRKVQQKATADQRSKLKESEIDEEVHRVQILDPATGTGTFLAEVIRQIHEKFADQQGIWSNYVEKHLIPRLNGFELLMASYAMAHLKLDMLLTETGYKPKTDQRLRVYLTNSLEEHHPDTGTLFANWLSSEANEANQIKRDVPVMVVLGNPPYSVSSHNKGQWIQNLIVDYKKGLNEKKINLDDDYIKFTRYGQYFIQKTGEGVLAYISNSSFIDGPTHRQMRKSLLTTFDKIYILDLHGSANKSEVTEFGEKDENVFDIKQGVSINLFVKSKSASDVKLADVFHFDLVGTRKAKYDSLANLSVATIGWTKLPYKEPYCFFIPKDYSKEADYKRGFALSELFKEYCTGLETQNDDLTIQFSKDALQKIRADFSLLDEQSLKNKYNIKNGTDWRIETAKKDLQQNAVEISKIRYRPFDTRFTYYTGKTKGFHARPRFETLKHLQNENLGLCAVKINRKFEKTTFWVSDQIVDKSISSSLDNSTVFPLYLYPSDTVTDRSCRIINFEEAIIEQFESKLALRFTTDSKSQNGEFSALDVFDYIYAVVYSDKFRDKYSDLLKIDFARIPYPQNDRVFWELIALGKELRQTHLLTSPIVNKPITKYPIAGSNNVEKPEYQDGKVWINSKQYFEGVPETAWTFYIGGYQPAQKWLKDRKGRELSIEDIQHYQKIIVALSETDRIMKEIDKIEFL